MSQQPMEYARHAADAAVQPGAGDIRRRGRRHDRRVATLTAAGVLPAAGLGTGLDLRGGGTTPSRSAPNVVLRPGGLGVAAFGATQQQALNGLRGRLGRPDETGSWNGATRSAGSR